MCFLRDPLGIHRQGIGAQVERRERQTRELSMRTAKTTNARGANMKPEANDDHADRGGDQERNLSGARGDASAVDQQRQRQDDAEPVEQAEPPVGNLERIEDVGPGCASGPGHDTEPNEGKRDDDQDRAKIRSRC